MIFDIGAMEVVVLIILGMLLFGPEKLPKLIQDIVGFIRKVRSFSDTARDDIRKEMGPEFKDFEFQDLHPKRFAQKHLMENDDLGIKELRESLDLRKELNEVSDAVNIYKNGGGSDGPPELLRKPESEQAAETAKTPNLTKSPDLSKPVNGSAAGTPPVFDPDAT
ncbi:sec-independent translocase [Streptomyces sp. XM4193]|uniref:sec-independent translocase n=1 Tax=Streptomyces sp. XM4193 TaxID=2929782 RepID=UPI001FF8E3FB|nr:sec-independent translocase [Streptomyces sp. XM4193]MCK1796048.1 sec-independent translocase [Streptomyces sp. XM4193]